MDDSSRKPLKLQLTIVDALTIQDKKLNLFITSSSIQPCYKVVHGFAFATQIVVYIWIFCKTWATVRAFWGEREYPKYCKRGVR